MVGHLRVKRFVDEKTVKNKLIRALDDIVCPCVDQRPRYQVECDDIVCPCVDQRPRYQVECDDIVCPCGDQRPRYQVEGDAFCHETWIPSFKASTRF
ncbi:hypothetical protein ElyMa_000143400 [Elysia marginata]|uniref:TIL domain-containing protein n=1 Tax=Elysia marginata TaxID=1093978 RepID=A0AAV4EQ78_9GAST|nr:hypothetical protein ElyMa_000143400 [Elysia marginata]